MTDIIAKLNELRLERNLSVYRLAELSGINQSTLANTFSRGVVPSVANLEAICHAMGITLAQFFSEDERTEPLIERERAFLETYRRLPPKIKQALTEMVNACAENIQL